MEEGRKAERSERLKYDMDRIFARVHVWEHESVVLTTMGDVKEGTVFVATDDGRDFVQAGIAMRVLRDGEGMSLKEGERWLTVERPDSSTSGSRVKLTDTVLILAGTGVGA